MIDKYPNQGQILPDHYIVQEGDLIYDYFDDVIQDKYCIISSKDAGKTVKELKKKGTFSQDAMVVPSNLSKPEPKPTRNDRPAVWDLVIQDMHGRDRIGKERYGTRLQPFNGRNALVDAYQEALDLVVYLRQKIEEDSPDSRREKFESLVRDERNRQHSLWGDQSHHPLEDWMLILGEEVGELHKAVLENKFNEASVANILEELVQVAAVCMSIFEQNPTLVNHKD